MLAPDGGRRVDWEARGTVGQHEVTGALRDSGVLRTALAPFPATRRSSVEQVELLPRLLAGRVQATASDQLSGALEMASIASGCHRDAVIVRETASNRAATPVDDGGEFNDIHPDLAEYLPET